MKTVIYDLAKLSHTITYEVEAQPASQLTGWLDTNWTLRASCSECGWFTHQTITSRDKADPFTQQHRDVVLNLHHIGVGFFAIPREGREGNDIYVREEDRTCWRVTFRDGRPETVPVEEVPA